jgi:hypothetical protein
MKRDSTGAAHHQGFDYTEETRDMLYPDWEMS